MRRRYTNLWRDIFPYGYHTFNSVQGHSNVLVVERERHGVEHYNPRHLPVVPLVVDWRDAWIGVVHVGETMMVLPIV